jgi:antirestriction protein ArdC
MSTAVIVSASSSTTTTRSSAPHRKNATLASDSPYQQRTAQKDNSAQALIQQSVAHLLELLRTGHSQALAAYLAAMARFHQYSFGNILAIARQRPAATRVAGFSAWKELGRFVKKGEKGIQILAPVTGYRRRKAENSDDGAADNNESEAKLRPVLIGFRAVYVFDVSQTEGLDLPEFDHQVSGEVGGNRDRLIAFLGQQNIRLEFTENIAPALGVSYGGKIALYPGQSPAEEFVTLVHETAHELLHKADRRTKTTGVVRETEAEAVAFVVGEAVSLKMGRVSSDYIQMYAGNAALVAESLEVIQRASAVILGALYVEPDPTQGPPVHEAVAEVA